MIYEQVKDLPPAAFKRYCGVQPETFAPHGRGRLSVLAASAACLWKTD